MPVPRLGRLAIAASAAFAATGAGAAQAAIPAANGKITACYQKRTGAVRVIDPAKHQRCGHSEKQFSFNVQGPAGPAGPAGAAGAAGSGAGTAYSAGDGLKLNGTTFALDPFLFTACAGGQAISKLNAAAAPTCSPVGGVTGVSAGNGIAVGGSAAAPSIALAPTVALGAGPANGEPTVLQANGTGGSVGVHGSSDTQDGISGVSGSTTHSGVWGDNTSSGGFGVSGSARSVGVFGETFGGGSSAAAVYGLNSGSGYAGLFAGGPVRVEQTLDAATIAINEPAALTLAHGTTCTIGVFPHTDSPTPSYWSDRSGDVHLEGCVNMSSASAQVATLPTGLTPAHYREFATASSTAGSMCNIAVGTDGAVIVTAPAAGDNCFLDGVDFLNR